MSFSTKIRQWRLKRQSELINQRRQIILRLFRAVIYDTPVDEGTLRANWRCSAVNPLTSAIEYRPATAVINEIDAVLKGSLMSETVYLRNNLPYAYPIEYLGHSRIKAPQGMVRKNVARFQQIARSAGGT